MTSAWIHVAVELTAWLILSFATVIAGSLAYGFRKVAKLHAECADATARTLRHVQQKRRQEREFLHEVLLDAQARGAELYWLRQQEELAAKRGEPWSFTGPSWPTPEELLEREQRKAYYEQEKKYAEHANAGTAEEGL